MYGGDWEEEQSFCLHGREVWRAPGLPGFGLFKGIKAYTGSPVETSETFRVCLPMRFFNLGRVTKVYFWRMK